MNSQPKIVVISTGAAPGNVRQADRGIATASLRRAIRLACLGAIGTGFALLAACGQKGPLYLPDHPPPSHRHVSSNNKPATAPASTPSSAAPSASTPNTATQP